MNTGSHSITTGIEDRKNLLGSAVEIATQAAYGIQTLNDQQVSQVLGDLVKTRLLSADDSYKLRDRLNDQQSFSNALDARVQATLKRKGILSEQILNTAGSRSA